MYICMPGVFHATEKDTTVVFISLWKLKFLACLLNVTRFVMRIISYTHLVYFTFNYCSVQWTAFTEVVTP
jgi:hypothetical protein